MNWRKVLKFYRNMRIKKLSSILIVFFIKNICSSQIDSTLIQRSGIKTDTLPVADTAKNKFVVMFDFLAVYELSQPKYILNISLERIINKNISIAFQCEGGTYFYENNPTSQEIKIFGKGILAELRYYLSFKKKKVGKGIFIGTYFKYLHLREQFLIMMKYNNSFNFPYEIYDEMGNVYGIGLDIGYKFGKRKYYAEPLFGVGIPSYSGFPVNYSHILNNMSSGTGTPLYSNISNPNLITNSSQLFWYVARVSFKMGFYF
jgi:hypothetical protein